MSIFQRKSRGEAQNPAVEQTILAETALTTITDGLIIVDQNGLVVFANPAAIRMTGYSNQNDVMGMSYLSMIRLENGEGMAIPDNQNPLAQSVANNQSFESRNYCLVSLQGEKTPIFISALPAGGRSNYRILTFRNIAQELAREGEQTEFISTASHEMRTPVASIEGYLGLALNPQTATIDDRARQYLNEAHKASQHLGKLFQDLLDVTKLDDKRVKLHLVPAELTSVVREIFERYITSAGAKHLSFTFGVQDDNRGKLQLDQQAYAMVDMDFLQEIMNNLIENAIKYTDAGGAIWSSVRADGDEVLINVTDTGMGISPDNLSHIFQKFYRVDNSATRTIGGTGLGLYIVKERVEAMGGRVWAESTFSEGSTFYVALPRISQEEYDRQLMVMRNTQAMAPQVSAETSNSLSSGALQAFAAPMSSEPVQAVAQPIPSQQPTAQPVQAQPAPTVNVGGEMRASDMEPDKLAEMKKKFAEQVAASGNQSGQNSTSVVQ